MPKSSPFLGANLKVVLLSVLAATTFWFFNALNKSYNARISYPIQFDFKGDSLVVVDDLPDHVVIDVSSGGWNLLRKTFWFNIDPIVIALDNPTEIKFLTRSSLIPIVTEQVPDLDINYLVTDTIQINIEPKVSKKVAIKIDSVNLSLANNFRVVSPIMLNPDSIVLTGALSNISKIGESYVIKVPRQKIDQDFNRKVSPNLSDFGLLNAFPDEVNVSFEVEEFANITMEIKVSPANFPNDSSAVLNDTIVNVNFWVKTNEIKSIKSQDFIIMADLAMLNRRDSTILPILIASPYSAFDLVYEPDTLKVKLRGKKR